MRSNKLLRQLKYLGIRFSLFKLIDNSYLESCVFLIPFGSVRLGERPESNVPTIFVYTQIFNDLWYKLIALSNIDFYRLSETNSIQFILMHIYIDIHLLANTFLLFILYKIRLEFSYFIFCWSYLVICIFFSPGNAR